MNYIVLVHKITLSVKDASPYSTVADPDLHQSGKLDPDPYQSGKLDPFPHQSGKVEALEGHFGALEK
jgi:hypothetical protein